MCFCLWFAISLCDVFACLFFYCVDFALFSSVEYNEFISMLNFMVDIYMIFFFVLPYEFRASSSLFVLFSHKKIWPVDIIKTWNSPKSNSPFVRISLLNMSHIFLRADQKKMRKNGIQRMQTKWKLCKQNSHELQLSVRNVKNIFFHKILPKA